MRLEEKVELGGGCTATAATRRSGGGPVEAWVGAGEL